MQTFSNFSNESAFRGSHPLTASPATAVSQEGHPAATCSPSIPFGTAPPNLKLGSPPTLAPPPLAAMSTVARRWWLIDFFSASAAHFFSPLLRETVVGGTRFSYDFTFSPINCSLFDGQTNDLDRSSAPFPCWDSTIWSMGAAFEQRQPIIPSQARCS